MTPLLALRGVAKAYRGDAAAFALEVPEFDLLAGEALALAGPSGSGKSTLLMMLALASPPDDGEYVFAGSDVAGLWRKGRRDALAALRARKIGVVPQTGGLLPYLTVAGNIALTQRIAGCADPARVLGLAEELGISAQLRKRPAALSVGQRQRVAIARALAHRPALVLADEPTASVHPELADAVLALLKRECAAAGAALLVATHDPDRAARAGYPVLACETHAPGADGLARSVFARASLAKAA
ncbi:ATP-binding cassette domain-containing protein [Roseomonas terrae]|jgi:putative ABC transport system ATP-binding protein|uniref:ATP-binding cassette domain-containing protein n=1 Tax=Neoroseomonas terrae TaxID=424799 RepID=A0ABS5EMF9_9PROT|nr:ATP-binding cassette domain-containing protein [Neoroseomonas terrae]MBR0652215.1 ATP-binding cassette domain-containing protein [Neoroseomonas terrae]